MAGDVIELPHMKEEYAANDFSVAMKRFYVIDEITRAAEGFSQTWYPHLYRLRLKMIMDSQEYKDILDLPAEDEDGNTLRDILSTYEREMQINNAVINQAEEYAKASGYETAHLYTVSVLDNGEVAIVSTDYESLLADGTITTDTVFLNPGDTGYKGYLVGDGFPPNGALYGSGTGFPSAANAGDYFLRIDLYPNRLFRYSGTSWQKVEDAVRQTLTPDITRQTLKGTFVNNETVNNIAGEDVQERQALSKALKVRADT